MELSFRRKLAKNIFVVGLYSYGTQALYFFSTIILSRLLLPSEFGFVTLITVFVNFISTFTDAGISHAIIRSDYGKTFQKALGSITLLIGIFLFVLMSLFAYPLALFYGNIELVPATIILSGLFIIRAAAILPISILTKELKFSVLGRLSICITIINILLTIVLAFLKFSYWAIIIPQIITGLLHYFLLRKFSGIGVKFYRLTYMKVAYKKAKSLINNVTGFNIINYWASNADLLLVGKLFGESNLGLYGRANSIMALSQTLVGGLFNTVLYPSFKELKANGGDFRKEYETVLGFIGLITFPMGVLLMCFPSEIVIFLWGKNWADVAFFLPYFGLLILSKSLLASTPNIYVLEGKERANMFIGLFSAVIMVISITIGAFISILYVPLFYVLAYVILVVPINIYWGFVKSLGYSISFVARFWLPKIVFFIGAVFCLRNEYRLVFFLLLGGYFCHLVYYIGKEFWKQVLRIVLVKTGIKKYG